MYTNLRPLASTGIAMIGASAIAITSVAATPVLPDSKLANPAVQLSAAVDPITPWLETFDTAETNLASLVNTVLQAPAPVVQQIIANQIGYLTQLPDFPVILAEMLGNLQAAITAPFAVDTSTLTPNTGISLDHPRLWSILSSIAGTDLSPIPVQLQPLMDFSTTYTSGMLLGLVGPVIRPVLALAASATAIVENLTGTAPDLQAAFSTLLNTPAAMVDAFLNGGQTLDLTPVLDALGLSLDMPVADMESVGITFGGLLSPGGSIFNALSFDMRIGGVLPVNIPGYGPGFIGSLIGLTQTIAKAIGWDGEGNPLAPPLETPEPVETPEPELRQAADTSLLAAQTVALGTSPQGLEEEAGSADQVAVSIEEPADESGSPTTPSVLPTDEESPGSEEPEEPELTEELDETEVSEETEADESETDGAETDGAETDASTDDPDSDGTDRDGGAGDSDSSTSKSSDNDGSSTGGGSE